MCSRGTRPPAVGGSICAPAKCGPRLSSITGSTGEEEEEEEDDDRWLLVFNEGSRAGYRDMERFVAGIEDSEIAAQLARALDGRGAFHRFRHQLTRWPGIHDSWNAYSAERRRGRARAWLATAGYTAMTAARANGPMNAT